MAVLKPPRSCDVSPREHRGINAGCLDGRTAVVTGGASGIGAATVRCLAAAGASVAALDIDTEGLTGSSPATMEIHCDVADEHSVAAAVRQCHDRWDDHIDVLVNVAGIEQTSGFADTTIDEWDRILDINLRGAFLLCREVAPGMVRRGKGSIINLSSTNGLVGSHAGVAYGASKGGMVVMTKDLAIEMAHTGVRVNAVCPGTIDTPLVRRYIDHNPDPAAAERSVMRAMPIGRLGRPEEVAEAILFFASDRSSLCTGVALPVDGGLTAR